MAKNQRILEQSEAERAIVFHETGRESVRQSVVRAFARHARCERELKPLRRAVEIAANDLGRTRGDDREVRTIAALARGIEEDEARQVPAARRHFDRQKIESDRTRSADE